jgi:hypothetical protein
LLINGTEPTKVAKFNSNAQRPQKNALRYFLRTSLFESGTYSRATSCAKTFEPLKGSTSAFGRWSTEPLHPAIITFGSHV